MLFLEPSHWIMQMRQFGNLRRLVEEEGADRRSPVGPVLAACNGGSMRVGWEVQTRQIAGHNPELL